MWKLPSSPSPVKQILTISNGNGLIYRKAKFSLSRRCHDSIVSSRSLRASTCARSHSITTRPGYSVAIVRSSLCAMARSCSNTRSIPVSSPPGRHRSMVYLPFTE